jgi:HlyD family secretion protein
MSVLETVEPVDESPVPPDKGMRKKLLAPWKGAVARLQKTLDFQAPRDDAGGVEIRNGLIVLIAFFGVIGGWAAFAPLDAGVSAPGVIVVSGNRQTLQHRDGGIVSRLLAKDGDHVAKGQVLVELSTVELSAKAQAEYGELFELEAMRARLTAESTGTQTITPPATWASLSLDERAIADAVLARQQRELSVRKTALSAQSSVLAQRKSGIRARIEGIQEQIRSVDTQLTLIEDELVGVRQLNEKGFAPLTRVRALERSRADLVGQKGSLLSQVQQAKESIGETSMQDLSIHSDRSQEIAQQMRDADTRIAELRPQLTATRTQLEQARIRAPVAGTVVGLRVFTVGGVIAPGAPILDVVPEAQPLVIQAQIKPEDADDLRPGMTTQIRFTAWRDRGLPIFLGKVERISADRLVEERSGRPYFTAEVVVPRAQLARAVGGVERLNAVMKAGLPVEVVVPLRKRTALQYIFEPLGRALWGSFREH